MPQESFSRAAINDEYNQHLFTHISGVIIFSCSFNSLMSPVANLK